MASSLLEQRALEIPSLEGGRANAGLRGGFLESGGLEVSKVGPHLHVGMERCTVAGPPFGK